MPDRAPAADVPEPEAEKHGPEIARFTLPTSVERLQSALTVFGDVEGASVRHYNRQLIIEGPLNLADAEPDAQ